MFSITNWHACCKLLFTIAAVPLLAISLAACSIGSLSSTRPLSTTQPVAAAEDGPTLVANPASGSGGMYVQVTGEGWPRNMMVVVALSDSQGKSATLAASDTDESGKLATGFLYPIEGRWMTPGSRAIVAQTADGTITVSTDFTVVGAGNTVTNSVPISSVPTSELQITSTADSPITATTIATPTQLPTVIPTAIPTAVPNSSPVVVAEESSKGGEGNRPPVVEADLTADGTRGDKGRFIIVATATDPDDNLRNVVAVIKTPPLNVNYKFELKEKEKIEIKFTTNKIEIGGPDPQALLEQIQQYGGIVVQDGQRIELKRTDSSDVKIVFEGTWQFEAQSIVLQVIAIDTEGASAESVVTSPVFDQEDEDDGDDNEDDGDDDEDDGDDDEDEGRAGPPINKDQCKKGGWRRFDTPRTFKNQGDCIQYVNTGR